MAIGLMIAWSGEVELNSPFFAEILEFKDNELRAIVRDYRFRDLEVACNVLPNEVLHFAVSDLVESFSLYPLGEVVDDFKYIDSLPGGCRKLPHYAHPQLYQRPR